MYLNLLYYAAFTLYNFKNDVIRQTAIAYTSTTITFISFLGVIIHRIIQLVKRIYLQRKHQHSTNNPLKAAANQAYVSSGDNTEHEGVTFSVICMGMSDSISDSPNHSPAEPGLTKSWGQRHAEYRV